MATHKAPCPAGVFQEMLRTDTGSYSHDNCTWYNSLCAWAYPIWGAPYLAPGLLDLSWPLFSCSASSSLLMEATCWLARGAREELPCTPDIGSGSLFSFSWKWNSLWYSCEIFETYFCSCLANLLVTVSRILPGSCLGVMVDEVAASKDKNLSAGSGSLLTISRCGRQTSCPSREGDSPCHQPSSCLFLIVLFTQDLSGSRKPRRWSISDSAALPSAGAGSIDPLWPPPSQSQPAQPPYAVTRPLTAQYLVNKRCLVYFLISFIDWLNNMNNEINF